MPVYLGHDSEGCYAKWGSGGKKYYYQCNNAESRARTIKKANEQAKAAYSSGYKKHENE